MFPNDGNILEINWMQPSHPKDVMSLADQIHQILPGATTKQIFICTDNKWVIERLAEVMRRTRAVPPPNNMGSDTENRNKTFVEDPWCGMVPRSQGDRVQMIEQIS